MTSSTVLQGERPAAGEVAAPLAPPPRRPVHALTGVRILAALWVVLFHIRGNLYSEFPEVQRWVGPLLDQGGLGVDLFYVLSGYVLVLNYGSRMGRRFQWDAAGRFWWARLSRVWPAYFVTLLVAALWHGFLLATERPDPVAPRDFTVLSFLRQTFLVVQWTEPDSDRLTWNGPAWTVSAEALAYLLFPVLVLVVYRLAASFSVRGLAVLALGAVVPTAILIAGLGTPEWPGLYAPFMWILRIGGGFVAGALACAAVQHVRATPRARAWASHLALAAVVVMIACFYAVDRTGRAHLTPALAIPFFVLVVGALGLADRHIARLLSTRVLVVGGMASYSVYLVHMLVIEPVWYLQGEYAVLAPGTTGSKLAFVLVPFVVLGAGYALWRWLEEPARRRMRAMAKVGSQ
ncbi:acyltransferase family protein [Georgenia ruanii]|uniref:Acyltransferase family protein n=1 Tax=Georgenia ruanii TaxID=348442 RepID=A0A7J9UUZ3_9MICO|nr:acyltransferase [Georgenia ruanii]MPV87660.1 acyltransferase family protein [Georgenia ruanii]